MAKPTGLPAEQRRTLARLIAAPMPVALYLAGGAAIGHHLGHRTSLQPGPEGCPVASLRDLAVMKLAAIAKRGLRRDFWDLHEILTTQPISLGAVVDDYVAKFGLGESNIYHVLRSLTYFDDAERDRSLPSGLTEAHWEKVKAFFRREAPRALAART